MKGNNFNKGKLLQYMYEVSKALLIEGTGNFFLSAEEVQLHFETQNLNLIVEFLKNYKREIIFPNYTELAMCIDVKIVAHNDSIEIIFNQEFLKQVQGDHIVHALFTEDEESGNKSLVALYKDAEQAEGAFNNAQEVKSNFQNRFSLEKIIVN